MPGFNWLREDVRQRHEEVYKCIYESPKEDKTKTKDDSFIAKIKKLFTNDTNS